MLPDQINIDSFDLDIHLVGDGFGESIVITIGKRLLIGIDCCGILFQKGPEKDHFLDSEIKNLRKDAYKLWILTHYHYDHFQSFHNLISNYEDQLHSVLSPPEYTSVDFSYLAEVCIKNKHLADQEYKLVKDYLDNSKKTTHSSIQSGEITWVNTNLVSKSGQRKRLVINVCAPTPKEIQTIKRRNLKKIINGNINLNRSDANKCSYVIHICLGNFEGLFLADAPFKRTQKKVWGHIHKKGGISLVKVAHHGSLDGTNKKLIDSLKGPRVQKHKRIALICPYDRFKLPHPNVIKLLESEGFSIIFSNHSKKTNVIYADIKKDLSKLLFAGISNDNSILITESSSPLHNISSINYKF